MAEGRLGNERIRLAILLAVLAAVVIAAGVRFFGGGGIGSGRSRSGEIEYEARNLQLLQTDVIGRLDDQSVESGGNPFAFRPPPTPTSSAGISLLSRRTIAELSPVGGS